MQGGSFQPGDIRFASFIGEYNITFAVWQKYHTAQSEDITKTLNNEGLSVAVFYLNSQKSCAQFLKSQKFSLLIGERTSTFSLFVFNIKSRSPSVVFLIITSFTLNALAFIKQIIVFHISRFYARSVKPADILISSR